MNHESDCTAPVASRDFAQEGTPRRGRSDRPLRIQHVIGTYQVGGAERCALQLAREQQQAGHDVSVVSLGSGPLAEQFASTGLPLGLIEKKARLDPTLPPRLALHFALHRADVVHTHNPPALIYAGSAARSVRARLVHSKHGVNRDKHHRVWLRSTVGRLAHALVAVSDETARVALEQGEARPERIRVIQNGVDVSQFRPRPEAGKAARAELGIEPDVWVIGSVGRFVPDKNYGLLIRAAAPILRTGGTRLVLVGDGPERDKLQSMARELGVDRWVRFPGIRHDTHDLLSAMDVFALSSRTEGLPLALLEAMATALPIVATRVGGIPAAVQDDVSGLLVEAGDREHLTEALRKLVQVPSMARAMGQRARETAVDRYGLAAVAERTTALYVRLLRQREGVLRSRVREAIAELAA
ncbi:MAG: glycosyltransferase [Myxococcota bacterium]